MNKTIWQKKIPSLLGLILILLSIGITSFLAKNQTFFITRANPNYAPFDVRITNVTDSSFTVSYRTKEKTVGVINYGKDNNLGEKAGDDKVNEGIISSYIHHITVKNLNPKTKYFFLIKSSDEDYLNKDSFFETATASKIEEAEAKDIQLSGQLILPNGNKPQESIVYLTSESSQMLSFLVKNGEYNFNTFIRNKEFFSYLQGFEENFKLLAIDGLYESEIIIKPESLEKIPLVILSKDYDFTLSKFPVSSISSEINFPSYSVSSKASKDPVILSPKQEEEFKDLKPLFSGSASPAAEVEIVINSEEIKTKIKADPRGNWSFRPKESLSPGEHTITIKSKDKFGILKTIKRSFTVYAQGSQVSETATPSATPKINLSPTPALLTSTPTPTPQIFIPTSTPSPTQVLIIPRKPPPPQAGSSQTIALAAASVSIAALGLFLFLLSRGNISL